MLPFPSKSWSMTRSREIRWADLPVNSKVIFALDAREERANPKMWSDGLALAPERCIAITETNHATLKCRFAGVEQVVGLTDYEEMAKMIGGEDVYIDVSGLPHSAWAPLLKAAMAYARSVRVMYFEPDAYRYHASPSSVSPFDLSSAFLGVQPLPGFANLRGPKDDAPAVFVPFLGFEGSRSRQVAMTLDPIPKVVPVVGLPGFKLQYPQWALACNQEFLEENSAQSTVRYAAANCPFEAYNAFIARMVRTSAPKKIEVKAEKVVAQSSLQIIRGGLPVFQRVSDSKGLPFIHSVHLRSLGLVPLSQFEKVRSIGRGVVQGHFVLFPRVGIPNRDFLKPVFFEKPVQFSDCVMGIRCIDFKHAKEVASVLSARFSDFASVYKGTGAKYISVGAAEAWVTANSDAFSRSRNALCS